MTTTDSKPVPPWIAALNQTRVTQHTTPQHTSTPPTTQATHTASAGIPITAPHTPPNLAPLHPELAPQPVACDVPTEEEHVEALPIYQAPPELNLAHHYQPVEVPATEHELPTAAIPVDDVVNKPWQGKLTTMELLRFNQHVEAVMNAGNVLHAANLLRLRGWPSTYVGVIASGEQAERHIALCNQYGQEIGGWADKTQAAVERARAILKKEMDGERNRELRGQWMRQIGQAREMWKRAVANRDQTLIELNQEIEITREEFRRVRDQSFEQWCLENDV